MSRELGRISGPLLAANLLRQGVDLAFETTLLYLNVNTGRIGIKTDAPTRELLINSGAQTIDLLVDNNIDVATLQFAPSTNTIRSTLGNLVFNSSSGIVTNNLQTDFINLDDNAISTLTTDKNLEIRPNGSGAVEIFNNTTVYGSIHATGDITAGGNVIIGDESTDSVVFNADITSDLLPNVIDPLTQSVYSLGSSSRHWLDFYTELYNGSSIEVGGLNIPDGTNLALRPGKIWFVASNGNDTYQGNHENGPFATIAKAISVASTGDEIRVYPGTYVEVFPLTVPTGVTIKGMSLRSVTVKPTLETNTNDAFLLNGETTVSDITVSDFYYNSTNDTGYAFRFALGAKTTTRSPYIQNCSVITRGSAITAEDPLGFDSGDAGKSALVDGSVCDPTTLEAAMLFHSVTCITPGVDAITMTNGVRVEWLNSFTYFANRSLYATNGSLGLAGLGITFGAEIRSIASASVYGNYGAYADGADTLMYLIQYNFGYIGAGKDSSNDLTLVVQTQEVTELNSGKIYYQSVDQQGTFRVGNEFYADFTTGTTSIDVSSGNITGLSSLTVVAGQNETYIDAYKISTGNLVVEGNTLKSVSGPVNIVAATGEINLTQNANVAGDIGLVGNLSIEGTITVGNQTSDTVSFAAKVDSNLLPKTDNAHTIGSATGNKWAHSYFYVGNIGDVLIDTNRIITVGTDQNLSLSANGTGRILVPNNNVEFTNNLTVTTGTTTTKSVNITGALEVIGNYNQTGAVSRTGATDITGHITVSSLMKFYNLQASSNTISATVTNSNINLVPNGTGQVVAPNNTVEITNALTVSGTTYFNNVNALTYTITANTFTTSDAYFTSNYFNTTGTDHNLELRANGTGKIYVPLKDVDIVNNLTVNGETYLKATGITGSLGVTGTWLHTGNASRTGNSDITGHMSVTSYAQFENIKIDSNVITTTVLNSDLSLKANGTGKVVVPTNTFEVTNNLTVHGATGLNLINVTNTVTAPGFDTGDVLITSNYITTQGTNHNLELRANGTGKIYVPLKNVEIVNNLTVNGDSSFKNTTITGLLTHVGSTNQTGNITQTGKLDLSNLLTVTVNGVFPKVSIIDNRILTTTSNTDLELRAVGTGKVYIPYDNVRFNQKLTVSGATYTGDIQSSGTVTANTFTTGDITITGNQIYTTIDSNNLILNANGTGQVALEKIYVQNSTISTQASNENIVLTPAAAKNLLVNSVTALKIPVGTTAQRVMSVAGEMRFSTTDSVFSGFSTARRTLGSVYSADRLTKAVAHPTNNTITFTANSINTMEVLTDRMRFNGLLVDNTILAQTNTISAPLNTDMMFAPTSGETVINAISIIDNQIINNISTPITFKHTGDGYLKFAGTFGIAIPHGPDADRPDVPEIGHLRFNTDSTASEVWSGTAWIPIQGAEDVATMEEVLEISDLWSLILG